MKLLLVSSSIAGVLMLSACGASTTDITTDITTDTSSSASSEVMEASSSAATEAGVMIDTTVTQ